MEVEERRAAQSSAPSAALPTVDVVIPCYNYARYLDACVRSVLAQQDVRVRILIIDDASPDDTAVVGQRLADAHPEVEFRRHPVNKRHIATYNEGLIGWSTSEYCVLLSADDLLTPGSLGRAVRIMEADPGIGMVYGPAIHFQSETELPATIPMQPRVQRYEGKDWVRRRCKAGNNVITSPEVVVRGTVQRSVGGYRTELPHSGDLEMWLRIAAVSHIAYLQGTPQAFYRVHGASMQRTQFLGNLVDLRERLAAFESFFLHSVKKEDEARASNRDAARRALAREALWDACRLYDHNRAEPSHVDALVGFAHQAYAQAASLKEYRALRRRQRLGAALCHRTQLFILPASIRWAARWLQKRHWLRSGV